MNRDYIQILSERNEALDFFEEIISKTCDNLNKYLIYLWISNISKLKQHSIFNLG